LQPQDTFGDVRCALNTQNAFATSGWGVPQTLLESYIFLVI